MKTRPVVNAFIGGAGMWGFKISPPGSSTTPAGARSCRSSSIRLYVSASPDAILEPLLLTQLAGCAALVSTGKYLQGQEDEQEDIGEWIAARTQGPKAVKEVDLYRETWVRYFGYSNEVGEAFRPIVPPLLVTLSYVVAFLYIFADSYFRGAKVAEITGAGRWKLPSFLATIDSLLFQGFASVVFPSFTINRWVTMVGAVLHEMKDQMDLPDVVREYLPTATGLLIIPIICGPLDVLTNALLSKTYRPMSEDVIIKGGELDG